MAQPNSVIKRSNATPAQKPDAVVPRLELPSGDESVLTAEEYAEMGPVPPAMLSSARATPREDNLSVEQKGLRCALLCGCLVLLISCMCR